MDRESLNLMYTTENAVKIYVAKGAKSDNDFIVKYEQPGKLIRTPKHIHLVIDLLIKKYFIKELTLKFARELFDTLDSLNPTLTFPPVFQFFNKSKIIKYRELDKYGEYSVEFTAAIFDLIMIQEKTNYPKGYLNKRLYKVFLDEKDIFSLISSSTFGGKKNS
jgi:hypothetical protein